jgi:eukaryotic-like serine/threonine-protein kinase
LKDTGATELYQQAKPIALAALERQGEARQAFVVEACGGDCALQAEVAWLIDAAEDATDDELPEQFQVATRQAVREVSLTIPLPRDYRLIRRLNEGGMGVVYLAQRADGDIDQQVALKMLHLGDAPDASLARRFATERQILSRLNHPNIAHLIDGGLTAEGRPFLATEFVDGQPIDYWVEQHGCSLKARLRLFLKVCTAVDYAHRHMVIHRDLKPPNILVTPEGEPKLLDFGIARLLDTDDDSEHTERGQQALTMAYASPEQIRGEGLSAATDVYSLGVLLYQLLLGRRPFDHIESAHLVPNAILAGQMRPPEGIPHDLKCIILKAMRRETTARYQSVRELADDIQRYLDFRPVQARRGQLLYRARRFSWRHRWAVAVSLVLLSLLLTFFIDREAQLQRIAWERDRAEAVTEFINELFAGANSLPSRGNEVTVREILDLGTGQLDGDDSVNPAVSGSIFLALGRAYNALGLGEQALPLLIDARRSLSPSVSTAELALIQAEIGAALDSAGRAVEAIEADQQALALFERISDPGPVHRHDPYQAQRLGLRIRKLRNQANVQNVPLTETIDDLGAIIEELDQLPEPYTELRFEALAALVGALVFQGEGEQALEIADEAAGLAEALYADGDPRRLRGQYVYATALMLSDPQAAVGIYESLIRDHERLIGPSQRLANTIGNLGVSLSRIGRNRESMAAFEQSAEMIEAVAGRDHYLYRLSVANLAALQLRQGEARQAEQRILDIIPDLNQRSLDFGGVETLYLVSALDILGSAQSMQARWSEAATTYRQALHLLEAAEAEDASTLAANIGAKLKEVESELAAESSSPAPDEGG